MAPRRTNDRRIFLAWETRRSRLIFFSRRGIRAAIVALLAAATLWVLVTVERRHRATFATRTTIANVMQAIEAFRADHADRCPTSLGELVNPGGGHEPYLSRLPEDGWGRPFRYRCPGRVHPRSGDLVSGGPSGNFDSPDQIE